MARARAGAGRGRTRDLQPQPLRGRPRAARAGAHQRQGMRAPLPADPRFRDDARGERHDDRQVLPAHLEGRAARAAAGAHRRSDQALEVRHLRSRRAQALGCIPVGVPRRARRDVGRACAVVRDPGELENPSQRDDRRAAAAHDDRHEARIPAAEAGARRREDPLGCDPVKHIELN
ncbi:hypothetical protein EMIT0158MI4_210035 [Burkholderia ambifaria]